MTLYFLISSRDVEVQMLGCSTSGSQRSSLVTPRRVNTLVTDYDVYVNASLHEVIATRARPRDPQVLNLVRKFLDPPSDKMTKLARRVVKTPQTATVIDILNGKVRYRIK